MAPPAPEAPSAEDDVWFVGDDGGGAEAEAATFVYDVEHEAGLDDHGYDDHGYDDHGYDDHGYDDHDHHDYVDLPGEGRLPRWLVALVVVGLILGVVVGGGWWWYQRQVDPPGPPGEAVSVPIPSGASTSRIGSILADEGVISSSTLFNLYVGGKDVGPFQAGTYVLHRNSSFDEALAELDRGPGKPVVAATTKVTIPEGYTVAKILDRIHQKVPRFSVEEMRTLLAEGKVPSELRPKDQPSYEGLLFPATYDVGDDTTALQLLTEMAGEMDRRVDELGVTDAQAHLKRTWGLDLTAYDMVKVASMIQYEAATADDAPKIGTVTYNRLQKGMPLQYDSTSIYEAGLSGKGPADVDYKADSPYNTRTRTGLPPTPIAAPGEYALRGAVDPADGPWLYFVLTNTKEVTFAVTYDEFLQAKALCEQRGLGCG